MMNSFLVVCMLAASSVQLPPQTVIEPVTPLLVPADAADIKGDASVNPGVNTFPFFRIDAPALGRECLDSVVGYNSDGSRGSLMTFRYSEDGWWTGQRNYYWEGDGWGDPVQTIDITRLESGNVLSECNMAYGSGVRNDYEYDDRDRGVRQTFYSFENDEWIPVNKGEYVYDDNDNIIEETISFWNRETGSWDNSNHNMATWDDKHRQTSIEQTLWNGSEWETVVKIDYKWYDGPYDPDYVEGTEKERMTYRGEYLLVDGKWMLFLVTENYFHDDGRIAGQSWKYYNREYCNWYGGDDLDGRLARCDSWISQIEYDARGLQKVNRTFQYIPGPEEKLFELGSVDFQEYEGEDDDFIILEVNQKHIYDAYGKSTDTIVVDKLWTAYDQSCRKLWTYEEMPDFNGDLIPVLEDKYEYDDAGNRTEVMSFSFKDGVRVPMDWISYEYDNEGNVIEIIGHANAEGGMRPMGLKLPDAGGSGRDYRITDEDKNENWEFTNLWNYSYENGMPVEKRGYRWDGDDWISNQGQINHFDFSKTIEQLLVPQTYTDIYKVESIESLYGYGDSWISTESVYYYSENVTGVEEISSDSYLTFDGNEVSTSDGKEANISIFDMTGKVVFSDFASRIPTIGLPAGSYIVTAVIDNGISTTLKIFLK